MTIQQLLQAADEEIAAAERVLHGTRKAYRHGCHCLSCRAAEARYRQTLRRAAAHGLVPAGRRVPATGVRRQLHSLRLEGYSYRALAARLDLHPTTLSRHHHTVSVRTQAQIEAAYRDALGPMEGD